MTPNEVVIAPLLAQEFDWKRMEEVAADELCTADEHRDYEICVACMAIRGTRWALQMRSSLAAARLALDISEKNVAVSAGALAEAQKRITELEAV